MLLELEFLRSNDEQHFFLKIEAYIIQDIKISNAQHLESGFCTRLCY